MKYFIVLLSILVSYTGFSQLVPSGFDRCGNDHNTILSQLITGVDVNTPKRSVYNLMVNKLPANQRKCAYKFSNFSDPYTMLLELKSKGEITVALFNKVKSVLDQIKTCGNYQAVDNVVSTEISMRKLVDKKYEYFLSVLKHTSYFWDVNGQNGLSLMTNIRSENRFGGPNEGIIFTNVDFDYDSFMKINWWKVLGCDAVGALGGAILGGGAGAAVGAGVASACSAINQY